MTRNLIAGLVAAAAPLLAGAQSPGIVINEIMQSNIHIVYCDGEFSDSWVELHNPTTETVNLSQWKIGTKDKVKKAYSLPDGTEIAAGGYLIIHCDKVGEGLHADIRLESGKGEVYLFDPQGNIVDKLKHAAMPAPDVAYGRTADGAADWAYFVNATPGAPNEGATSELLLPEPQFSTPGGIFSEGLEVTVEIPELDELPADVKLCVTTDGREPQPADSVASPFTIAITESTPLRARLYSAEALSRMSTTNTYLLPGREITMPIFCLTTNDDYLFSEEMGSLHGDRDDPESNLVKKWRRPLNIEMFDGEEHELAFNQIGETEAQGWSSLQWPQKSLKIYANKRFGSKRFNHVLWPDDKPEVDNVKSFSLRNGGNSFALDHIRDSYLHRLFGPTTDGCVDYMAYRPAVAFINGRLYGLIDLRERSNDDFVIANYPEAGEEFAMIEDWWEDKTGESEQLFNAFRDLYTSPTSTYEELAEVMDMNSFATILLADAFAFNVDTPDGNKVMWKPVGGKWRWLLKDMDVSFLQHLDDNDYISYLMMEPCEEYEAWYKNTESGTALYRKCLQFDEFTDILIDKFVAFNGDFLHPDYSIALLDTMTAEIREERQYLKELYGLSVTVDHFVENLKPFINSRTGFMADNLRRRYELGAPLELTIENSELLISLNGHRLVSDNYRGTAYSERALRLEAEKDGQWQLTLSRDEADPEVVVLPGRSIAYTPAADVTACKVEFVVGSAIDNVEISDSEASAEAPVYYNIQGQRLNGTPQRAGIYIRVTGQKAEKVVIGSR